MSVNEPLRKVERKAERVASARRALNASIRDARAAGASLRAIASASSLSHEQVRRIIAQSDS